MRKDCSRCGVWKKVEEFGRDSRKRDGLRPYCKTCQRAYNLAARDKRRDRLATDELYRQAESLKGRIRWHSRMADPEERAKHRSRTREYWRNLPDDAKRRILDRQRESPQYIERYRRSNAARDRQVHAEKQRALSARGRECANREGMPYSDNEIETIIREDISLTEMAYMLGRSYSSIRQKRNRLRREGLIAS